MADQDGAVPGDTGMPGEDASSEPTAKRTPYRKAPYKRAPKISASSEPVLGLAHPDEEATDGGKPLRRWLEFGAAAVALAIGAGWLLLPSDKTVNAASTAPVAYATPPPWPAADGHGHENLPKGYRGSPPPAPLELSSPVPEPTGPPPPQQYLATMHVFAGPKNVRPAADGRNLTIPCGSGRGTDQFREVRYRLRGAYRVLTGHIVNRDTSPTASVRVHILGVDGTLMNLTLEPGQESDLRVTVTGSEFLRIRVFCESPKSSAEFQDVLLVS